ncbi:MAG: hypothetical protein H0X29_03860 [Parachlamydiaceae bacterium]|nr:hypothetical protein [Parachlamydiaceae bacterium]
MESEIIELQKKNEVLTQENAELKAFKNDYNSAKQSINRMSTRLRKLCKRLTPTNEIVTEMQKTSEDMREMIKTLIKNA